MPRLTLPVSTYKRSCKKFTNYRYQPEFKQILPPVLRNHVALKGDRKKVAPCLQEMSHMLVCLKVNDYNQGLCSKEVATFNKCFAEHEVAMKKKAQEALEGKMASRGKVNSKQLNKLLQKYPQKNPK